MLACTRRWPENPPKWLSSTYLRYSRGAATGEATSEEGKGRLEAAPEDAILALGTALGRFARNLTGGCMARQQQKLHPEELLQFVPEALKLLRQGTGLRQTEVSKRSGLTKAMLSSYETGKTLPNLGSLTAFLMAMDKDLSDLQTVLDMVRKVSPKRTSDPRDLERELGRVVLKAIQDVVERQGERDAP
jgi:transcriptional regulator with XRE-family HTH domain